jgi:hypothetical protein
LSNLIDIASQAIHPARTPVGERPTLHGGGAGHSEYNFPGSRGGILPGGVKT